MRRKRSKRHQPGSRAGDHNGELESDRLWCGGDLNGAQHCRVPSSTTADDPTVEELVFTPIDQFPSHMYSMTSCEQLRTSPPGPDPSTDYGGEPLEPDEIIEKASVIARGRVTDVDTPVRFIPDGAPQSCSRRSAPTSRRT